MYKKKDVDINGALEDITESIRIRPQRVGYYKLKQHKSWFYGIRLELLHHSEQV